MSSRIHSLRARLVLTFATALVSILLVNAAYLLFAGRNAERQRLEAAARQFAVLATPALGQSFESYFESGYFKFRQSVLDLLARSSEITAILVCDVEGRVLFDSRQLDTAPAGPLATLDGERLDAVRKVEPSEIRPPESEGRAFEIVVPYLEDWGRHRLSAVYHVSLAGLEGRFRGSVVRALQLVAVSGLLASLLGLVVGTRLTRPLEALAAGVQRVARGDYAQRVEVRSRDELQAVAEAFNDMSSRLQRTIGEMERRNAELERFTYTVSHDLRSPLVTVLGFLGLLERDIAAGRTQPALADVARVRAAATTMERLLRELLELSRVGRVTNPPEDVPLAALAEEARQALAGRLAAAGAELHVAAELPVLRGDRVRLQELVLNLVDNATKFTGGVKRPLIRIGSRPGTPGPVCFVEDNGIGVDPKHHQRIFNLFERLDPAVEGTGIGLALVKRIVEVHGGEVWVESEGAGRGSRFCFVLGAQPAAAEEAPGRPAAAPYAPGA